MIKTAILSLALSAIAFNANAQAKTGGFEGPSAVANTTVAEAQKMSDDTSVVLTGKIEKGLGDEKYLFSDATGSIVVEIDDEDWRGLVVKPENTVEIRGEVDRELMKDAEIDVDVVKLK